MHTHRRYVRASRPARTLGLTLGVALGLTLILTGCGQAPWLADTASGPANVTLATPSPAASSYPANSTRTRTRTSPTPTPAATIAVVVNDLATGSTSRTLTAGDVSLAVNYWSTLRIDQWTAAANKPVNFSIIGSLGTDSGQKIYISKVTVAAAVNGPDGTLPAPPAFTDQASVSPGYDMKTPQSYGQVVLLPPVDAAATSITLSFTYELLVQTSVKTPTYSKQTATDQLTVALME